MRGAVAARHTPRPVPDKIRDYRKLLERKDIDGVVLAPNHWHALQSSCSAGGHVYVEKPVTHDCMRAATWSLPSALWSLCGRVSVRSKGPIEGFRCSGADWKNSSPYVCAFETGSLSAAGRRRCHHLPLDTISGWGRRRTCPYIAAVSCWHWNFNTGKGHGQPAPMNRPVLGSGRQCAADVHPQFRIASLGTTPEPPEHADGLV